MLMPDRRVFIIAPWGNPFGWKSTRYCIERKDERQCLDASTSLIPLIYRYIKYENVPAENIHIQIYVPETLTCLSGKLQNRLNGYLGRVGMGDCLLDKMVNNAGSNDLGEALVKAIGCMTEAVREFYREELVPLGDNSARVIDLLYNNTVIETVPNIGLYDCGRFRARWQIARDARYRNIMGFVSAYMMLKSTLWLLGELVGMGIESDAGTEIAVDLTHGQNYLPVSAYRVLRVLGRLSSAAMNRGVDLRAYQSDPYIPLKEGGQELNIWEVYRYEALPMRSAQRLVYSYARARVTSLAKTLSMSRSGVEPDKEWFSSLRLDRLSSYMAHGASAIHYSLPLAVLQVASDVRSEFTEASRLISWFTERAGMLVRHLRSKWRGVRMLNTGELLVEYLVALKYEEMKSLVSGIGILAYLLNIGEAGGENGCRHRNIGGKKACMAAPKILDVVLDKYLQGPHYLTSKREVSIIESASKGSLAGKRIDNPLAEKIMELEGSKDKSGCGSLGGVDLRNFVAHAGLAHNIICVERLGEETYVYYGDLKKMENLLENAYKQIEGFLKRGEMMPRQT